MFRILTKSYEDEPVKKNRNGPVQPKRRSKKEKHFRKLQVEFREYLQSPGYF